MVLQVFEYVLLLPENQISQKQLTFNQKEEGEQMSKHIDYFIFKKHDEECSVDSKRVKIGALCLKSLREKGAGLRGFEPLANRLRADCSA